MTQIPKGAARDGFEQSIHLLIDVALEARKAKGMCVTRSQFFNSTDELAQLWKAINTGLKNGRLSVHSLSNLRWLVLDGWVDWNARMTWDQLMAEYSAWKMDRSQAMPPNDCS